MKNSRQILNLSHRGITLPQILSFSNRFNPFILLNTNKSEQLQKDKYGSFDWMIAAGSIGEVPMGSDLFSTLRNTHDENRDWLFGYMTYDVKNQVEKLSSLNHDGIKANESHFFIPRYIFEFNKSELKIQFHPEYENEKNVRLLVDELIKHDPIKKGVNQIPTINARVGREEYIDSVNKIKSHIHRGDIYEMNYCMEYFSENAIIDPPSVYNELNTISPMPFSAYFRIGNHYLMCASPERFIAKRGNKIISQPIKGTAKRGSNDPEDRAIIEALKNDPKEQSENVMIVDLVRNDLSRTASRGSVVVEELFGVKTFRQLHQMVSTVTSEIKSGVHFTEVIRNSFPMGSMTGAPKIRAMEIIEEFESTKRGIFSGSVGYITPNGDFDFNVVIRSILYNSDNRYLSFMAGSAITAGSDPEREYEECMLKATAMKKVLT